MLLPEEVSSLTTFNPFFDKLRVVKLLERTMKKMKEALGISGWVTTEKLSSIDSLKMNGLKMWADYSDRQVEIRVDGHNIDDVRIGAAKENMTFVQLIVNDANDVEVIASVRAPTGFTPFSDPVLANLTSRAVVSKIMI